MEKWYIFFSQYYPASEINSRVQNILDPKFPPEAKMYIRHNKNIYKQLSYSYLFNKDIKQVCKDISEKNNLKLGKVVRALRVCITGSFTSPSIFEIMNLLGRDECISRMLDVTK